MKYLILAILITSCGAYDVEKTSRTKASPEKNEETTTVNETEKQVQKTEVTINIESVDRESERVVINNGGETAPDKETTDGQDTDNPAKLPSFLLTVCSGDVVMYGDRAYYLGEKAFKLSPSWSKVTPECRLRLNYDKIEKQIKVNNTWEDSEG